MGDLLVERGLKFECVLCNTYFARTEHLKRHIVATHLGKVYVCGNCGLVSNTSSEVTNHMITTHPEEPPKYLCFVCNTYYGTLNELNSHEDIAHYDKTSCPDCSMRFTRRDHMLRHYKTLHTENNPTFNCTFCERHYKRQDHLTRHLRVRHNVSKITCKMKSVKSLKKANKKKS